MPPLFHSRTPFQSRLKRGLFSEVCVNANSLFCTEKFSKTTRRLRRQYCYAHNSLSDTRANWKGLLRTFSNLIAVLKPRGVVARSVSSYQTTNGQRKRKIHLRKESRGIMGLEGSWYLWYLFPSPPLPAFVTSRVKDRERPLKMRYPKRYLHKRYSKVRTQKVRTQKGTYTKGTNTKGTMVRRGPQTVQHTMT